MGLIYFCLFILFVPTVISFFFRRFRNPWQLHMVFGKKGSGKSSYLIKLAYKYQKKGFIVYTNMEDCVIPGVRIFNINHLGDFIPESHSLLLLDEVGMVWDNRDFKNFRSEVRDFFKLQRHYKVICYLASQTFDIDKKIRDLTDSMMLCTNFMTAWSLGRTISKRFVLTTPQGDSESRISEQLVFEKPWHWHLTYIPRYTKGYDSFDTPQKPYLRYKENPFPDKPEKQKRPVPEIVRKYLQSVSRKDCNRSDNEGEAPLRPLNDSGCVMDEPTA